MRALAALLLLLVLLCFSPMPAAALRAGDENQPPVIHKDSIRLESWPEFVGEVVSGRVNVSDPDGDDVSVVVMFVLTEEWAEALGASREQRIHNITAELVEPAPAFGPRCYEFEANTTGWLPGAYDVVIVAIDEEGAKSTYRLDRRLNLRIEMAPPEASRAWIGIGLGLLACLIGVMLVGFSKAVKTGREERLTRPAPPWIY